MLTLNVAEAVSYSFMRSAINFQAIHAINFSYITQDHIEFLFLAIFILFAVIVINFLPVFKFEIEVIDIHSLIQILLSTLFFIFFLTIIHDFSRNRVILKFIENEDYSTHLQNLLNNKTMAPQILEYDKKNLKNLILIQLESFPYEFLNDRVAPNLYNYSKRYEFISPIKSQPYSTWTTGGVVLTQCGIPQILPDIDWEYRQNRKFLYNKDIICISDFLGSLGYQRLFALTGTEKIMGYEQWRAAKKFIKLVGTRNDLDLTNIMANEVLPKLDHDVRTKNSTGLFHKSHNGITEENDDNHFILFLEPEDTHIPYLKPNWCKLNNDNLKSYERCFNCDDYAISLIIQKYLSLKMYEHTVMVVYPDHIPYGSMFTTEKFHLFLLFPGMEKVSQENKIKREITYYDFGPTILDLIGVKNYLPSFPFGQSIYNETIIDKLKHPKPNENDLDVIDNYLNLFGHTKHKCYTSSNHSENFYYSDKPCKYSYN